MSVRIQKWDILKFFLMFCVVLGHFAEYLTGTNEFAKSLYLFIYSFHMPLFLFISGLFSKSTVDAKRWDKILGYLVLYFFSKVLFFVYNLTLYGTVPFRVFGETGIPWFMFALFVFSSATVLLRKFRPGYVLFFSVLLSLLAGYDDNINSAFVLSRIIVFYPFYYAGYAVQPKELEKISHGFFRKFGAAVIIAALIAAAFYFKEVYFIRPLFVAQHPYSVLKDYAPFGFLLRLACYAVSTLACLCFIILTPDKLGFGLTARLGKNTMPVYLFHFPFIVALYFKAGLHSDFLEMPTSLLIFPISLLLTVLLANPLLNKLTGIIFSIPQKALKKSTAEGTDTAEIVTTM